MVKLWIDNTTYYYNQKVDAELALKSDTEFHYLLYAVAAIKDDGCVLKSRATSNEIYGV